MERLGKLIKTDLEDLTQLRTDISTSINTLKVRNNPREKETLDSLVEYETLLYSFMQSIYQHLDAYGKIACPEYLAILSNLIHLAIWSNNRQFAALIKDVCGNRTYELTTENRTTLLQLLNDEMFDILMALNTKNSLKE